MKRTITLKSGEKIKQETIYVIDSEVYGECTDFDTLEEAEASIRACGDDFAGTVLREVGRAIRDERDNTVGYIRYK